MSKSMAIDPIVASNASIFDTNAQQAAESRVEEMGIGHSDHFEDDFSELPTIRINNTRTDPMAFSHPNTEPRSVIQPQVQPSPSLRKSLVPREIELAMYPLGDARTYDARRQEEYASSEIPKSVYGGNPFAAILKSRGGSRITHNKNDLSDLEDLRGAQKSDGFAQTGTYCEELVVLLSKEDPSKPLDAPGQPPYLRIPLHRVRRSKSVFAKLLDQKDKRNSIFPDSSIVYSFDACRKPNVHIQEYAVYVDSLLCSLMAKEAHDLDGIDGERMLRGFWMGLKVWGLWVANASFHASYTEMEVMNGMVTSAFVHDPVYTKELYQMIEGRNYCRSYTSVERIWPWVAGETFGSAEMQLLLMVGHV